MLLFHSISFPNAPTFYRLLKDNLGLESDCDWGVPLLKKPTDVAMRLLPPLGKRKPTKTVTKGTYYDYGHPGVVKSKVCSSSPNPLSSFIPPRYPFFSPQSQPTWSPPSPTPTSPPVTSRRAMTPGTSEDSTIPRSTGTSIFLSVKFNPFLAVLNFLLNPAVLNFLLNSFLAVLP